MPVTPNDDLLIPWGYGTAYKRLGDVHTILMAHYHPEYVRRLCAWLAHKAGRVGIGGTWRAGGAQPNRPGFAPEGKSFHQDQAYADGFVGACAVDLVAPDGPDGNHDHDTIQWHEVPAQGSAEAKAWGVHCNVASESWHMQPVEIDGWQSWWNADRPAPRKGYPLPTDGKPTPQPAPQVPGTYRTYTVVAGDGWYRIANVVGVNVKDLLAANGADLTTVIHPGQVLKVPGIHVPPPPAPDPDTITLPPPTIKAGSAPDVVRWLQCMLRVSMTGVYDAETVRWLKDLQGWLNGQRAYGPVAVDGIYGPQTANAWAAWRRDCGLPT